MSQYGGSTCRPDSSHAAFNFLDSPDDRNMCIRESQTFRYLRRRQPKRRTSRRRRYPTKISASIRRTHVSQQKDFSYSSSLFPCPQKSCCKASSRQRVHGDALDCRKCALSQSLLRSRVILRRDQFYIQFRSRSTSEVNFSINRARQVVNCLPSPVAICKSSSKCKTIRELSPRQSFLMTRHRRERFLYTPVRTQDPVAKAPLSPRPRH